MAKEKLSDKESALIAAALAEAARLKARGDASGPARAEAPRTEARPPAAIPPPAPAAPAAESGLPVSAVPDKAHVAEPAPPRAADPAALAERIARMMEAERAESLRRKQRMKTAGTALIVAVALPVMAWALLKLLAQLAR